MGGGEPGRPGVNLNVYRTTLAKTRIIGERVRGDFSQTPGARTIVIQDLAEQPNGVFFGGSELIGRIQTALPSAVAKRAMVKRRIAAVRIFGIAGIRRPRIWCGNRRLRRVLSSRCYDGRAFPRL
jgi:hypothetical protein